MQRKSLNRQVEVTDPAAAAVFTHSHLRRVLLQFAARPRSVGEVAGELAIDLKQLHHAVTKLCRLGLVEVVQVRKRAGRGIKLYQCTGTSYFIPCAAAPVPFSRGLAKELQGAIERETAAAVEGMVFALDAQGRVAGKVIERRGARPAPLDSWRILRMSPARASLLKQELTKVLDRFQAEADEGGSVYLVHAGMARRIDQSGATDNPKSSSAA